METSKRILVTILKMLTILLITIVIFIVGAMIGYGVVGKGNMFDVFSGEIWRHIFDFLG